MKLNKEELEQLEEMAAALMPASEIAILMNIEVEKRPRFIDQCKNHKSTAVYTAYQRGRLTTKLELRKTVVKLAKAGSPAAEPLAIKFITEQEI